MGLHARLSHIIECAPIMNPCVFMHKYADNNDLPGQTEVHSALFTADP